MLTSWCALEGIRLITAKLAAYQAGTHPALALPLRLTGKPAYGPQADAKP